MSPWWTPIISVFRMIPGLIYQFGDTVILARTPDNFLVCGPAVGQILENTGDLLHLRAHVLHFKTFVAP